MAIVAAFKSGALKKTFAPVDELWLTFVVGWQISINMTIGNMGRVSAGGTTFFCLRWDEGIGWQDQCDSGNISLTPDPIDGGYQTVEMHWAKDTSSDLYVDGALVWFGGDFYGTSASQINFGNGNGASTMYARSVTVGTTRGGFDIFASDFDVDGLGGWDETVGSVVLLEDPFAAPPPLSVPDERILNSHMIITDLNSSTLTVLDHRAAQRTFLFQLNQSAYCQGQVANDDPEINLPSPDPDSPALLSNNSRLLYWLRRETGANPPYVCRFGGIVMNVEDSGDDAPTCRFTAYDPWQLLMSRPARSPVRTAPPDENGIRYEATARASRIATDLLGATQSEDGETHILYDPNMIQTSDQLGAPLTLEQNISVGEAWNRLVATGTIDIHLDPLYDPIDNPGKVCTLRIVAQHIGEATGRVRYNEVIGWDQGTRSASAINRMVDGTRLANVIAYYTGQGIAGVAQQDATSIAAYGQYWVQQLFSNANDVTERDLVTLLALAELQIRRNGQRSVSIDLTPERSQLLPLRDFNLGDYLPVWASRNLREPLAVDYDAMIADPAAPGAAGYQRVYSIPIELDDNGTERTRGILTSRDSTSG